MLDPNITACREKQDLFDQYAATKAWIDFTQGLDIRLLTKEDIDQLNGMKLRNIHFAWDNPQDDLRDKFAAYAKHTKHKPKGGFGTVYCLTNYNSTLEQDLYRIYTLINLGYDPYVMVYDKPNADREHRTLQRWCNSVVIRKTIPRFEDYNKKRELEGQMRLEDIL